MLVALPSLVYMLLIATASLQMIKFLRNGVVSRVNCLIRDPVINSCHIA